MGTDIHGVFQRHHSDGTWEDIPSKFDDGRDYFLFAFLGNVRNGTGFAGIKTHTPIKPLTNCRGYPDGFEVDKDDEHPLNDINVLSEWRRKYHTEGEPLVVWMGDHSHSWATGEEILNHGLHLAESVVIGVVDIELYRKWDGKTAPSDYCGDVQGRGIHIGDPNDPKTTHVRVTWRQDDNNRLEYFFNEVERLAKEFGEIRYVFGFDS